MQNFMKDIIKHKIMLQKIIYVTTNSLHLKPEDLAIKV